MVKNLPYIVNGKKHEISNNKASGKSVQADVICYCKMTSFMALDAVTSFLRLKYVTNTCKRIQD